MTEHEFDALIQEELAAVEAEIEAAEELTEALEERRKRRGFTARLAGAGDAEAALVRAQRAALVGARNFLREPFAHPQTFYDADRAIDSTTFALSDVYGEIYHQRHPCDSPSVIHDPSGLLEQCACVVLLKSVEIIRRLHPRRVEFLPQLLAEAQFWDAKRFDKELYERGREREGNRLTTVHLKLFTRERLILEDPFPTINVWLGTLLQTLHQLRATGGQPPPDPVDPVQAQAERVSAKVRLLAALERACNEQIQQYPDQADLIRREFRKRIEQLREEES
jgi:hypothetical protein